MRLSQALFVTRREDPADAEVASHRLFVRAGFLEKLSSGVYIYTHLMWRVIKKIMRIVTEEMDRAGAQEVMLPILQPREIWDQSGRWDDYVGAGILFTLKDRKGAEHCLGPTHEEVITFLARRQIESYKQLPVILYQQQVKFRDEIRPRFGLMRAREFIMKDAYSFDRDEAGLEVSYRKMHEAYSRIFRRCGLEFIVVQADPGQIGGTGSEEFMVIADTGEDEILWCERKEACGYAANREKAESIIDPNPDEEMRESHVEHTPNIRTVEELSEFFGLSPKKMVKTLLYRALWKDREELWAVLIRGDQEVNETKLVNHTGAAAVVLADDETIERETGAKVGFAGPIGLPEHIRVVADSSVRGLKNFLCGLNRTDYHILDVNFGRDLPEPDYAELRLAGPGEFCPWCKEGRLRLSRGIEVGHIFKLGTKYSEAMEAYFLDEDNQRRPLVMGCYGIGSSRIAAAAVEQNHDEKGMVWPPAIAPYHVCIIPIKPDDGEMMGKAEELYRRLWEGGVEAVLDDRELSPGVRFRDADLIGYPLKVVVGRKTLETGLIEVERRRNGEKLSIPDQELIPRLRQELGLDG